MELSLCLGSDFAAASVLVPKGYFVWRAALAQ